MKYAFSTLRYTTLDQVLAFSGLDNPANQDMLPWVEDMKDYVAIVKEYLSKYIGLYYGTDEDIVCDEELVNFLEQLHFVPNSRIPVIRTKSAFVELLVNFVTYVTAVHNHVGNVAEYLMDTQLSSSKIRPGRENSDVQSSLQAMNIALLSGWKVPTLINDFSHTLLKDQHNKVTVALMAKFQQDLLGLADKIEKKNKGRKWPTNSVNPRRMKSSVSV